MLGALERSFVLREGAGLVVVVHLLDFGDDGGSEGERGDEGEVVEEVFEGGSSVGGLERAGLVRYFCPEVEGDDVKDLDRDPDLAIAEEDLSVGNNGDVIRFVGWVGVGMETDGRFGRHGC